LACPYSQMPRQRAGGSANEELDPQLVQLFLRRPNRDLTVE